MRATRVEAFTDGVMAILITIMVLELPKPDGPTWSALARDLPVLLAYVLSFAYIGVYWNNHHHMFQLVTRVRGNVLWANLHLLFWLSLVPFITAWASEEGFATAPVTAYGIVLLGAGAAYWILQGTLIRIDGSESRLARAIGRDLKGKASMVVYAVGIVLSILSPLAGIACYVVVAVMWLIPDRRIERALTSRAGGGGPSEREPSARPSA